MVPEPGQGGCHPDIFKRQGVGRGGGAIIDALSAVIPWEGPDGSQPASVVVRELSLLERLGRELRSGVVPFCEKVAQTRREPNMNRKADQNHFVCGTKHAQVPTTF